jgi:hypothetical protein
MAKGRKGKKVVVKKEKKKDPEEKPKEIRTKKTDIDVQMYRDLFKFLEEKVSVECFIDMHDQCYGKTNCQCECHKK